MTVLYIDNSKAKLSIGGSQVKIKDLGGKVQIVPIETVKGIYLLGRPQMTTQFMTACLNRGIPVIFLSKNGNYFGRLTSTGYVKAALQRKQAALYDAPFALKLSQRIVCAKIRNQLVVLRRYAKSAGFDASELIGRIKRCERQAAKTERFNTLRGYEGMAAHLYFFGLGRCVNADFAFKGRSRRPPKDPFNSALSLGYAMLLNTVYEAIVARGLNPYFGFFHRDAERHPTLASDLMEEWRPVIVDALVMSLISRYDIGIGEFTKNPKTGGWILSKSALNTFFAKWNRRMETKIQYFESLDYELTFRGAIDHQAHALMKAIEAEDAEYYTPVQIR